MPALPGPRGVRRTRPPGRRGRGARRHRAARRGRRSPHHVRRSRLPQRATARATRRRRDARPLPRRDLRLHGQGRARAEVTPSCGPSSPPPAACSWSPRSSPSTTRCSNGSTRVTPRPTRRGRSRSCATPASRCGPSWLPFTPWTTRGDVVALLDFVYEHDLVGSVDPVQYSVRLLLPEGSLLLDHPDLTPFVGPWDAERSTYTWSSPGPRDRRAAATHRRHRRQRRRRRDALRPRARSRRCAGRRPHARHHRPPAPDRELVLLRRTHRPPAHEDRRARGLVR